MKKWIICNGPDWYRPSFSSTRQIMKQFSNDQYSILWINPIAFKSPSLNSVSKKSIFKKIFNKAKTHFKIFKKVNNNFFVYVPIYIPLFNPFMDLINDIIIKAQMRLISLLLRISWSKTILWICGSFTLLSLLKEDFKCKVYDEADLISEFRTNDQRLKKRLVKKEKYLSNNVDYIFAGSRYMKEKLRKLTEKEICLLPFGVDFRHFNNKVKPDAEIIKIQKKGMPIVGYFGSLSDANDKEVFSIFAQNKFSVVIIGKEIGDYSELKNKKNIHFIGPVSYEILPSYAQSFDICLMNWIMAEWIENCYPVKTLEYLAMGKPVVSCHIPMVKELFSEMIYFANGPQEFLNMAKKALDENSAQLVENRIMIAKEHEWVKKYQQIINCLYPWIGRSG